MMDGVRNPEEVEAELAEKEKEKELKRTKKKAKRSLEDILAEANAWCEKHKNTAN